MYLRRVQDLSPLSATTCFCCWLLWAASLQIKVFKSTCKWLSTAFVILAVLFGAVLILPSGISPMAASLYTLIPGAFAMMMYGVVFSTVSEAGIPRAMTGTVIGIASIIGYLPDSIYSVLFGKWLDAFGGSGYNLFWFLQFRSGGSHTGNVDLQAR